MPPGDKWFSQRHWQNAPSHSQGRLNSFHLPSNKPRLTFFRISTVAFSKIVRIIKRQRRESCGHFSTLGDISLGRRPWPCCDGWTTINGLSWWDNVIKNLKTANIVVGPDDLRSIHLLYRSLCPSSAEQYVLAPKVRFLNSVRDH